MKGWLVLFCFLAFMQASTAQNLSNKGKEFWVGYGHNNLFTTSSQTFVLYLSAEAAATVTVSVNGTTWTRTYNIPANTVIQTDEIPKNGADDARITAEGLSLRGVHIVSDVPIVAYAHQYGGSSSGATMLMPVETFGYTYYSLNYIQQSNAQTCYSWAFVIASENNTRVQITPSAPTVGGKVAGTPFTIDLQKGEIYNIFGQLTSNSSGSTGYDLSGTKFSSIAGSDGNCHPIGVFSGASRMTICNTSSGEFMQQQIFPASAWGRRYLTYPTVSTNNINTTNINFFRIAVRDPSTIVKRNGVILTGLTNNFYYDISSNTGDYIEADKPVLVSQLTPSTSSQCTGYTGLGDPEMFYLSPLEQAITSTSFYNTSNAAITNNYVSVIVPVGSGYNSLRIDGSNTFNRVIPHPSNPNYRVVIKTLTSNQQHKIQSDSGFIAITYGFGNVESYGYNAGTLVNNLDILPAIQNTFTVDPASQSTYTCKNTPFKLSIKLSFKPSEVLWKFSQVSKLVPNVDTTLTNTVASDSAVINGQTYYTYKLPRDYVFTDTGMFSIPISITSPTLDNCSNTLLTSYQVKVNAGPKGDFTWNYSGCASDTAYFFSTHIGTGYTVSRYRWLFDDGSIDSVQNPKRKLNGIGNHSTKLILVADNGCFGDTTKIVPTANTPVATFGMAPTAICGSGTVTFTDTSSFGGSALNEWYWDFGNGVKITANNNNSQSQTYSSPGTYTIKHYAGVAGGCKSDTAIKTLTIYASPVVDFTFTTGCLQDSTVQFTNATTIADGQAMNYSWTFGDPNANASNPNTSNLKDPTHRYNTYGPFNVNLTVTTANGCTSNLAKSYSVAGFGALINFAVANETSLCSQNAVQLTNQMNITADSVYRIDMYWDFGNQPTVFVTDNTPTPNEVYSYSYPSFTSPVSKTITIKWIAYSKGGCTSEKTKTITLYAKPVLQFNTLTGVCINSGMASVAQAGVANGVTGNGKYYGTGTDSLGNFNPAIAGVGNHTITYIFTSTAGCIDSIKRSINVFAKPTASFTIGADICLIDSVLLTDNSSIQSPATIIARNWDFGDATTAIKTSGGSFYKPYATYGTKTIKFYVVSDSLCKSDTITKTVVVHPMPVADFVLPGAVCLPGGSVSFTNQSTFPSGTPSQLNYSWTFGDGGTSTAFSPSHTYPGAASYNVNLVATSAFSCSATVTKNLPASNFYQKPVADFTVAPVTGIYFCQGSTIAFSDSSKANSSSIVKWMWSFGDGSTDTASNPDKIFQNAGSFNVALVVTNAQGCVSDSFTVQLDVFAQPMVNIQQSLLYVPEGMNVQLQGQVNDTAFHLQWSPAIDFLTSDTIANPIIEPHNDRLYTLTATGDGGCTAYDSIYIKVQKAVNIPNVFSPNGDGINDYWNIINLGNYPNARVEIYDRYGSLVYKTTGTAKSWDGKLNGKPLPVGVYYYIIEPNANGYGKLSGSITLLR